MSKSTLFADKHQIDEYYAATKLKDDIPLASCSLVEQFTRYSRTCWLPILSYQGRVGRKQGPANPAQSLGLLLRGHASTFPRVQCRKRAPAWSWGSVHACCKAELPWQQRGYDWMPWTVYGRNIECLLMGMMCFCVCNVSTTVCVLYAVEDNRVPIWVIPEQRCCVARSE